MKFGNMIKVLCVCGCIQGSCWGMITSDQHQKNSPSGVSLNDMVVALDQSAIMELEHNAVLSDALGQEYANYGFCTWKQDGQRFLEASFLSEYTETGVAPVLEDGRPNIKLWLNCTLSHDTFFSGWGWEIRSELAKPFLEEMLSVFSKLNIGHDGTPSCVHLIRAIICGIDESEFISRI